MSNDRNPDQIQSKKAYTDRLDDHWVNHGYFLIICALKRISPRRVDDRILLARKRGFHKEPKDI